MDDTLAALFRELGEVEVDGAAPDPARVSAHLSGVGDESLLEDAARRPAVRRLLADVVSAEGVSGAVPEDDVGAGQSVPSDVRARLREAYAATLPDASSAAPERRPLPALADARRRNWVRAAAAALIVLVPGGLVLSLTSRRAEAGPSLDVEGIERLAGDGAVVAEGPQSLRFGERVAPVGGEKMALRLDGGGRVILRPGDQAHVACRSEGQGAPACSRAVLALDRGEALLIASPIDRAAVPDVLLPDGETLEILAGAAHVDMDGTIGEAGTTAGGARTTPVGGSLRISLRSDARVRFTKAGKASGPVLAGPASFRIEGGDLREDAVSDRDARALFRDIAFFGGPLRTAAPERRVSARQWRVLRDAAATQVVTRESDASGIPSLRMDLPAAASVRLAWEPDGDARAATRLTALLVLRPRRVGPEGAPLPDVRPARVRVSVEGVPGAEAWITADASAVPPGSPGGLRSATFSLPPGWSRLLARASDRLLAPDSDLVLRFETEAREGGGVVAWFTGLAFGVAPPADSVPAAPIPAGER